MTEYRTGSGRVVNAHEWAEYRRTVYDFLFYNDQEWNFSGQSQYFYGELIHYSDFMKAKKGVL